MNADSVCKLFGCWTLEDIKTALPPSWACPLTGLQRFDTAQIFAVLDSMKVREKEAAEEKRKADLSRWIAQNGQGRRYG